MNRIIIQLNRKNFSSFEAEAILCSALFFARFPINLALAPPIRFLSDSRWPLWSDGDFTGSGAGQS